MHTGARLPSVGIGASLSQAILEMSAKGIGITAIVDASGKLAGIFTDGDLRRTLEKHDNIKSLAVSDVMTRNPRTIAPDRLAVEAAQMMQAHKVSGRLLVVDAKGDLVGAITFNDLLAAGVI
jgi:arabinose-5-phosphate isomerase